MDCFGVIRVLAFRKVKWSTSNGPAKNQAAIAPYVLSASEQA
jgi:hypothetical protein